MGLRDYALYANQLTGAFSAEWRFPASLEKLRLGDNEFFGRVGRTPQLLES